MEVKWITRAHSLVRASPAGVLKLAVSAVPPPVIHLLFLAIPERSRGISNFKEEILRLRLPGMTGKEIASQK